MRFFFYFYVGVFMGGNIFKDASRIEGKENLKDLFEEQKSLLPKAFRSMRVPRFLKDKDSFGDLDIILPDKFVLYCYDKIFNNYETDISERFYTSVDHSFSYFYKGYQIDLIFVPEQSLDFAYNYHSFGIQGSLVSRIFRDSGLTLRTTDLVKKNLFDNFSGKLQLETNYYSVIDSLELDLEKFLNGFNDLEDLLKWIYASPYFNSKSFELSSFNHKKKSRFLKHKDSSEILRIFEELPYKESDLILKKEFFDGYFVNKMTVYKEYNDYLDLKNAVDGRYIIESFKIEPSQMNLFKNSFLKLYPLDYILSQSEEKVKDLLNIYYKEHWK